MEVLYWQQFRIGDPLPTILKYRGFRFFFFSNEGIEPPHVHVEKAGKYAKFWLDPIILDRSRGFTPLEIRRLRGIIEERAAEFRRKWDDFFTR